MPEIGATLREARMRARIDVSEIEAQTKIRAKYLRALENEEWSLLPGPTFVKSFLRTYAQALDLDGKALVEEYRLAHERPSDAMLEPIISTPQRNRGRQPSSGNSRGFMVAVGVIAAVIVVLIVLLIVGGGSQTPKKAKTPTTTAAAKVPAHKVRHLPTLAHAGSIVSVSLKATGLVNVCLVSEGVHKLVPGVNLQPGETTATYHAKRFEVTLGNSEVTVFVDGIPRTVPPSSEPIGYSITKSHGRQKLPSGKLPTCG
jgi:cytoskeleton protein RodZ